MRSLQYIRASRKSDVVPILISSGWIYGTRKTDEKPCPFAKGLSSTSGYYIRQGKRADTFLKSDLKIKGSFHLIDQSDEGFKSRPELGFVRD